MGTITVRVVAVLALLVSMIAPAAHAQTLADWARFCTEKTPERPKLPSPAAGATGVDPATSQVTWVGICTDNWTIYLDTVNPPKKPLATQSTGQPTVASPILKPLTKYYWQIVPRNPNGTNSGPVWSLTTKAATPPPPPAVSPDGTVVPPSAQIVDSTLRVWTIGPKNAGGFYEIRMGGVQFAGSFGREILWCKGEVWINGDDPTSTYYPISGTSFDFNRVTTAPPCTPVARLGHLAWDPTPQPNVEGYTVLYGTESGKYNTTVDVGPVLTYTPPPTLAPGTYYFAVEAYATVPGPTTTGDPLRQYSPASIEVSGVK